jgi:hypothetical protein
LKKLLCTFERLKVGRSMQGSHAQEFGSMSIASEHASNFEGLHKLPLPAQVQEKFERSSDYSNVEQHEADLHHLRLAAAAVEGPRIDALNGGHSVTAALSEQGQGITQIRGDESSDGLQKDASVHRHVAAGDAVVAALKAKEELRAAVAERSRVDEDMSKALEWLLWDEGVGELLGMQPQAGAALSSVSWPL